MQAEDFTEQDVRIFIEQAVADHWKSELTKGTAILLSVLGGLVKTRFPNFQEVIGSGLKAYLSVAGVAQSVTYPGVLEKTGLIPNGEPLPSDLRQLFPQKMAPISSAAKRSYQQEFWNAFFREIELHRYVRLSAGSTVEILDVDGPQYGEGLYEITKDDLVDLPTESTIPAKADATRAKIDNWLLKHGLDRSIFFRNDGDMSAGRHPASKLRSFEAAFSHLSVADQARIMIPLDIVLKLVK